MLSFWESDLLTVNDFSIIGGGILGLYTALELSNKFQNAKIAVYERNIFAAGASSKNAGFACFGSISEIAADRKYWGDKITLEIIQKRWEGIQRIKKLLGDHIEYENFGGYELFLERKLENDQLENMNQFLHPIFNQEVFRSQNEKIKEFGFSTEVKSLTYNSLEGQLHSGKLIQYLHHLLRNKGVEIYFHSEITHYSNGEFIEFTINHKSRIKTSKLIFCTNAFAPDEVKGIKPGQGQVLITKPIPKLIFKGCFHFQEGYYYFRNVENRILFGGGRHWDIEVETSSNFNLNDKIQNDLVEKLQAIISPYQKVEIEQQWSGIMAFSENKLPIIKPISQNIIYAMNCNGMGISLSPMTAIEIANLF